MDGLNAQGFVGAAPAKAAGRKAALPLSKAATGKGAGKVAVASEAVAIAQPAATAEDKRINGLRKFQSKTDMVFQAEFFGGIGGGVLAWGATKAGSLQARTVIKSIFNAPVKALRATKINEFHQLPANYMKIVSGYAKESALLDVAKQQVPKTEAFTWNPKKAMANASKRKEAIEAIIEKTDLASVNASSLKSAKTVSMATKAAETAASLEVSGAKAGQEIVAQASKVTAPVTNGINRGLKAIDQSAVGKGLESLTGKLPQWKFLDGIRGKNLSTMTGSLSKGTGKMSLFAGIIGAGVVAGVGATLLTSKKDNKTAKTALADMTADIGDAHHPMIENVRKAFASQKPKRALGTTLGLAGDVMNGMLIASPHGGMGVFAASMAMPMVGQLLVKENPVLNAYANLKQAEAGKIQQTPEVKLEHVRQLVAAVPSVASHGGYYNRLNGPVAEAVIAKKLNLRDTMALLADETAFVALAKEVSDKQQEAKAAVAQAAPTKEAAAPQVAANENTPKPVISGAVSQGRVAVAQKAAAV